MLHIDTPIRNTAVTSPWKHGGVLAVETVRLQTRVLHEADSVSYARTSFLQIVTHTHTHTHATNIVTFYGAAW